MAQEQAYGPVLTGPVVARAWRDAAFRQRLLAEAAQALREHGVEVPQGVQVRVVENSANLVRFTLPPKPAGDLTDEELDQVAAAGDVGGGVIGMRGQE